jgi:hypothetical protein
MHARTSSVIYFWARAGPLSTGTVGATVGASWWASHQRLGKFLYGQRVVVLGDRQSGTFG